jgi:hypothetical protein
VADPVRAPKGNRRSYRFVTAGLAFLAFLVLSAAAIALQHRGHYVLATLGLGIAVVAAVIARRELFG